MFLFGLLWIYRVDSVCLTFILIMVAFLSDYFIPAFFFLKAIATQDKEGLPDKPHSQINLLEKRNIWVSALIVTCSARLIAVHVVWTTNWDGGDKGSVHNKEKKWNEREGRESRSGREGDVKSRLTFGEYGAQEVLGGEWVKDRTNTGCDTVYTRSCEAFPRLG